MGIGRKKQKKKRFAWMPENALLQSLMTSSAGVLAINWIFQGFLGMDKTDRYFKIGIGILLTVVFYVFFNYFFSWGIAVIFAVLVAHSLNWTLNGHLFVVGRYVGFTHNTEEQFWRYTHALAARVEACQAMNGAAVFGAVTRGAGFNETSDLDVRFIRQAGWQNGLYAAVFTAIERTRALFHGFPLDVYLLDDLRLLQRMRLDEMPILLSDPNNVLQNYYAETGYQWLKHVS